MLEMNETKTNICVTYTSDEYMHVAMIAASSGTLSALSSLAVILVIAIFKKYNVFIQRLILYLCITALVNSLSVTLRFSRVAYNSTDTNIDNLCMASAFIDQTTLWSLNIAFCCVTFNLLLTVIFNKSTKRFEMAYLFFIFLFPFMFNWIPFATGSYGESGAWCWISSKKFHHNCSDDMMGMLMQYILWYVPHYLILGIILVAYTVVVVNIIRKSYHWRKLYDTESEIEKERMRELVMPIIFYPIGYFLLNLFPLINRIYHTLATHPNQVLWILHAVFSPMQGGFIALVYVLDKNTLQRLNLRELRAYLFHRKTPIDEYPAQDGFTDSFKAKFPFEADDESDKDVKLHRSKNGAGSTYGSTDSTRKYPFESL